MRDVEAKPEMIWRVCAQDCTLSCCPIVRVGEDARAACRDLAGFAARRGIEYNCVRFQWARISGWQLARARMNSAATEIKKGRLCH